MPHLNRKIGAGLLGAMAVVATPAVAHAADVAKVTFTTKNPGSAESGRYERSGAIRICGDIVGSSSISNYIMQLKRDLSLAPDPTLTSITVQYNFGERCSANGTGIGGNVYYNRGAWTEGETIYRNGYAVGRY